MRAERQTTEARIQFVENIANQTIRELRAPKPEKLRVLVLGASGKGDLRVNREQKRIRAAVEAALLRDLIVLDVRPAATTTDLMTDRIFDGDAINYAAQFYSAVANGQSIQASHRSGQAALALAGLDSADVPQLVWHPDTDPSRTVLVQPPQPSA